MPITQNQYNSVLLQCDKIWDSIFEYNSGKIVYVPDGTIYAELSNGDGAFTPYQITETCCSILKETLINPNGPTTPSNVDPINIFFDLDEQKCRWGKTPDSSCSTSDTPIKIVLNPVGNDGAIFTLTENDTCTLEIKFDYLFKVKCERLKTVISLAEAVGLSSKTSEELTKNRQQKFELESKLLNVNNELESLSKQAGAMSYSIVCIDFPTNQEVVKAAPTTDITPLQKLPFSNTGFGSLTNTDLTTTKTKVAPIYETKLVNFCLTDVGLNSWKNILGENNYVEFINGNPNSYTCLDVIQIDKLNQEAILNRQDKLIFECTTPFGEKTALLNKIFELSVTQEKLKADLEVIDSNIILLGQDIDPCLTILGQFENINATVTLDMVDNDGIITENIFIGELFSTNDNLYSHLTSTQDNSGFLVCGEPSINEPWASGCTGLVYPEFTFGSTIEASEELNVSICDTIKDILYEKLYSSSNLPTQDEFNQSLSPNVFNSNWLTYNTTIDITSGFTNNQIKLNVIINNSCQNLCLLIDQINMTKVCSDANRTNLFISQSPGFEITRIIDNKKSWLRADTTTERDFFIGDYDDTNKIRQTHCNVDEERLVLNSKEIDLTMNMASAVENDVWCYLLDNPNLLTGSTVCPNAYWGSESTGFSIFTNMQDMGIYNGKKWFLASPNIELGVTNFYLTIYFDGFDWVGVQTSNFITPPVASGNITSISSNPSIGLNPPEDGWVCCVNNPFGSSTLYLENNAIDYTNENCYNCFTSCGDNGINISALTTTEVKEATTLETFENILTSELTDAKNRKVLSAYPTLRAVYDRYMNATQYGVPQSNEFTYEKMDKFTGLIKTYWDDLIEQVVPATTVWGSVKVYTNTMFDQQKFKYKSYSTLFSENSFENNNVPSPINGTSGQCETVEVITLLIPPRRGGRKIYGSLCIAQMNYGSEFIGNVQIINENDPFFNG
jgi:hypothetical protein